MGSRRPQRSEESTGFLGRWCVLLNLAGSHWYSLSQLIHCTLMSSVFNHTKDTSPTPFLIPNQKLLTTDEFTFLQDMLHMEQWNIFNPKTLFRSNFPKIFRGISQSVVGVWSVSPYVEMRDTASRGRQKYGFITDKSWIGRCVTINGLPNTRTLNWIGSTSQVQDQGCQGIQVFRKLRREM